jgi:phosphate transport system substrate-binding protein
MNRTLAAGLALGAWALLAAPQHAGAAEPVRINGSGSALDMMKALLQAYAASHPGERVQMDPPLGSSGSLRALLAGVLDVAVVSRPLLPEEVARGGLSRTYGRTPLLVVTHPGVRKKDITTAELEQIYSGERTTWPDGQRIRVILRPEKDVTTKLLRGLSPGMDRADAVARRRPGAIVAVTDPEADAMVASTPGGIGTASLTSSIVTKLPLNILSLDGVEGTALAVAQGRYTLAKDLIFVTTARAPASALAIVDYAFSAQGRAIAEKVGVLNTGSGDR